MRELFHESAGRALSDLMDSNFDSTDRTVLDYVLFALAFIGFMIALGGIIVGSALPAFIGGVWLILCILALRTRRAPGE